MERKHSLRGRSADGSPNPVDVHVGLKLRNRRILLGLSQEKLGSLLGLTFQQIQKYEKGLNRIGASRLFDIGQVLNVPIEYFYEDLPKEAENASPRNIVNTPVNALAETKKLYDDDPMNKKETLELVRAYDTIPDHALAVKILDLLTSLGTDDSPKRGRKPKKDREIAE